MPKPVIAAIDPVHEDVAPAALGALLAQLLDVPLILAATYPVDLGIDNLMPDYVDEAEARTRLALERVGAQLAAGWEHAAPTTIRLVQSDGSPAAALHLLAEFEDAGVLVLGSSRRGPLGRVRLSAVTDRLLHGAPCPVAIAPVGFSPADAAEGLLSVAVAFSDSPDGRAALAAADVLAGAAGAQERLLVVGEPVPSLVAGFLPASELALAREAAEQAAQTTLDTGLAASSRRTHIDARLLSGSVADALAAAAAEYDLLVCGSRGHGPLRSLLLGGVSHELVRKARCPVLVAALGTSLAATADAVPSAA
jgi:nucleotide-binding universal stress UspA family protein